jgi:1-acyl-sn-glycerol-3-phosphate acyltransferase
VSRAAIWGRSWLYLVAFLLWTLGAALVCLPALASRASTVAAIRMWVRVVMWLARTVVGVDCRVLGRENLPAGACIVAAQHQSSFETYRLFLELERPVFVLKRELTWIPIVGWFMRRAGLVPIDRGAGARAMRQMLRAADAALARGDQVVIFPEGTRTPAGRRAAPLPPRCGRALCPRPRAAGADGAQLRPAVGQDAGVEAAGRDPVPLSAGAAARTRQGRHAGRTARADRIRRPAVT